eukprot:scpid107346/ scgid19419/ 
MSGKQLTEWRERWRNWRLSRNYPWLPGVIRRQKQRGENLHRLSFLRLEEAIERQKKARLERRSHNEMGDKNPNVKDGSRASHKDKVLRHGQPKRKGNMEKAFPGKKGKYLRFINGITLKCMPC